jgi:hypothetical protein
MRFRIGSSEILGIPFLHRAGLTPFGPRIKEG